MYLNFDKKQLKADILVLKGKGIEADVAEDIAQFKQAVEYAAWFQDSIGHFTEEATSEDVFQNLENANSMLEEVWWEISPIFEKEAITVAAAA